MLNPLARHILEEKAKTQPATRFAAVVLAIDEGLPKEGAWLRSF
jgi:hypothetical protein